MVLPEDETSTSIIIGPAVSPTPMDLLSRAYQTGANADVLEKLMSLQERYEGRLARRAFDDALSQAQAEIPTIIKNKKGHNSKYADFPAIIDVVRPILAKYKILYTFRTNQGDKISVTCILSHAGHYEENTLFAPSDKSGSKNDLQAIGSTQQYLMRYTLLAALGIATAEDDDGKASGGGIINDEQAQIISEMIEAAAKVSDEPEKVLPRFLKWAKVNSIEDIPASQYDTCVKAIKAASKAKAPAAS